MKPNRIKFLALLALLMAQPTIPPPAGASGPPPAVVALLPFGTPAGAAYASLREGIQTLLESRLQDGRGITVLKRRRTARSMASVKGFTGESLALIVGAKLRADYVVYGDVAVDNGTPRIDARMVDMTGEEPPVRFQEQASGPDGLIPAINRFATRITEVIRRRNAGGAVSGEAGKRKRPPSAAPARVDAAPTPAGVRSSVGFGDRSQVVVRSRPLDLAIVGIGLGDVDGDGRTETVAVTDHAVRIFRWTDGRFHEIAEAAGSRYSHYIGVDVADIDDNGIPEIFVSALGPDRNRCRSVVVEHRGGRYRKVAEDLPWCFRVSRDEAGAPVLLGQEPRAGRRDLFDAPIQRLVRNKDGYVAAGAVPMEGKAAVTGTAIGPVFDAGRRGLVALSPQGRIRVFDPTGRMIWESAERYGGSLTRFVLPDPDPTSDGEEVRYLPMRIGYFDLDGDGTPEVLSAVNRDAAKRIFQKFRSFDGGRMACLSWDGGGLTRNWTTRPQKGRISDFSVGDHDDDGDRDLLASLVTREGETAFQKPESVIIVFGAHRNGGP